ncbi:EscU/YscU/HrcU family type III secretion system export apparatus switch protein [Sneathiella sp.]|uniref:EscU/YscU/HrcU family type III secretion system export apparatus switch protein n=1 Tax=Sneathiella sp. TaxID=1964365 RepID=UPI00356335D8
MKTDKNNPGATAKATIAVALEHDGSNPATSRITATGRGEVAEQILQLAFAHGVKVRTDSDLAGILSEIEVDCPIPLEALAAVSEVMSYLYRSQSRRSSD